MIARSLRTWHRRIAMLIGLQLLLWTLSGLIFTLRPIGEVRGEHLLAPAATALEEPPPNLRLPLSNASAGGPARDRAGEAPPAPVPWQLAWLRDRWCWRSTPGSALYEVESGQALPELTEAEARRLARASLREPGEILAVRYLGESPPEGEYRGGPVPAWRIDFDHPEAVHLYLDANSGEVTKARTDAWRRFDFFWGLHIMDWNGREDFHHPLLIVAAIFGVLSSTTGLLLGIVLYARRWRRRASSAGHRAHELAPKI